MTFFSKVSKNMAVVAGPVAVDTLAAEDIPAVVEHQPNKLKLLAPEK